MNLGKNNNDEIKPRLSLEYYYGDRGPDQGFFIELRVGNHKLTASLDFDLKQARGQSERIAQALNLPLQLVDLPSAVYAKEAAKRVGY